MGAKLNIDGRKFYRLTVVGYSHHRGSKRIMECLCDCGATSYVELGSLTGSKVKSCGCYGKEVWRQVCIDRNTTHNMSKTRTYRIYHDMIRRCFDHKHIAFKNYGARGITVSYRWILFRNFLADMGLAPANKSLDRIDNDGNYIHSNCRWATAIEQANNRSNNRVLKILDFEFTMKQASELFNIPYYRLRGRIQNGWDHEYAVFEPCTGI